jgi:hypothetical protein
MPRRATVLLAMVAGAAAMTVGGGLSLALAMLSARDLSRIPAMPGAGIIGNFGVPGADGRGSMPCDRAAHARRPWGVPPSASAAATHASGWDPACRPFGGRDEIAGHHR